MVVSGEPGIGKTVLLDFVRAAAAGMPVLTATGVEAEWDLPFATLHQLLGPVVDLAAALPAPQAAALRAALGMAPANGQDRFLVAAGLLSVLGEAAAQGQGLVCLIDDAQWIDQASADALLFAARRFRAERVLMVIAVRPSTKQQFRATELQRVDLGGLSTRDAIALVTDHASAAPNPSIAARLVEATGGNPLALVELAGLLTVEQLSGQAPLPDPLPLTDGLEHAFLQQVRHLSSPAQTLLLVSALNATERLDTLLQAAAMLNVGDEALHEAESGSLLDVRDERVRLRHPLIRSAVVAGSSSTQRRRAHLMLARVLSHSDPDRSAWHRAAAALGHDESIANELERAAVRALSRSAQAAAAAAYERSAHLTASPQERGRRLLASARASWLAARPDRAIAAVTAARPILHDPVLQAELAHLHGIIEWQRGVSTDASSILLEGARLAGEAGDVSLALTMLVEAGQAAGYSGDMDALQVAGQLARDIGPPNEPAGRFARDLAMGFADMVAGHGAAGATLLRGALERASSTKDPAQLVLASSAAFWLGDLGSASRFADTAVRTARVADLGGSLPHALEYLSLAERLLGHYDAAAASASEGLDLGRETGQLTSVAQHLSTLAMVSAVRGDVSQCHRLAQECLSLALPRHMLVAAYYAWHAEALSELFQGRYSEALRRLLALKELPTFDWYAVPDLVEAAHRCGQPDIAHEAIAWMQPWVTEVSSPDAAALLLRCRALMAEGDDAAELFETALDHPDGMLLERGRTELLYGEWLRRKRRKLPARSRLNSAVSAFVTVGARPLAERARAELRAAGEPAHEVDHDPVHELTAQELQVAMLVAEGASNRDVAARLYISSRTVEYHLYKIYPKLGVVSRTDLARHLAAAGARRP